MVSYLKELRDAARKLPIENPTRMILEGLADEISIRVRTLDEDITVSNMQALNGAWSRADAYLQDAKRPVPTGNGGAVDMRKAA